MLLAAKFNLKSVAAVLDKFGLDLKGEDRIAFVKPSYKINVWDFKINVSSNLNTLYATRISKASLQNLSCVKCGADENVEMHHVRMLNDLNPKLSELDKLMAKSKRKQVPLCRACHLKHHMEHKR